MRKSREILTVSGSAGTLAELYAKTRQDTKRYHRVEIANALS